MDFDNIGYDTDTNAACVVTLAADSQARWHIGGLAFGYSAAPTGGLLTISDGTTSFSIPITSAGYGWHNFPTGLTFSKNKAVTITLAAGGSGVVGYLAVLDSHRIRTGTG